MTIPSQTLIWIPIDQIELGHIDKWWECRQTLKYPGMMSNCSHAKGTHSMKVCFWCFNDNTVSKKTTPLSSAANIRIRDFMKF